MATTQIVASKQIAKWMCFGGDRILALTPNGIKFGPSNQLRECQIRGLEDIPEREVTDREEIKAIWGPCAVIPRTIWERL